MEKVAVRNIRLCTKDCLCLYVCPTGATDTENSVIDIDRCVGCGVCAGACPSGAISMVPKEYPPQQKKTDSVRAVLSALAQEKADEEKAALEIASETEKDGLYRLMQAVAKSERLIAEDIMREAGYMLPQSANTHELLEKLLRNPPSPEFPKEAAEKLLRMLPNNETSAPKEEKKMKTYKCLICGHVFEVEDGAEPVDLQGEGRKAAGNQGREESESVRGNADGEKSGSGVCRRIPGEKQIYVFRVSGEEGRI